MKTKKTVKEKKYLLIRIWQGYINIISFWEHFHFNGWNLMSYRLSLTDQDCGFINFIFSYSYSLILFFLTLFLFRYLLLLVHSKHTQQCCISILFVFFLCFSYTNNVRCSILILSRNPKPACDIQKKLEPQKLFVVFIIM